MLEHRRNHRQDERNRQTKQSDGHFSPTQRREKCQRGKNEQQQKRLSQMRRKRRPIQKIRRKSHTENREQRARRIEGQIVFEPEMSELGNRDEENRERGIDAHGE